MLVVMAYERFVAIHNTLSYTVIMSQKLCVALGPTHGVQSLSCYSRTSFCHYYSMGPTSSVILSEHSTIVSASCSDPPHQPIAQFCHCSIQMSSLVIIVTTYSFIFVALLKCLPLVVSKNLFSACASHLTAITNSHGTIVFLYCVCKSKHTRLMVQLGSVLYSDHSHVEFLLNPLR